MGSVWLGSLPDVLRNAGLNVATYPGWETRSRSSGGYDSVLGIQVHHTASSGANPANEMAYMWQNASAKPIGAIYLATDGKVTVGAAGATNTSGRGGPLVTSRGTVPLDAGNRFLIAIEAANPGNGTPWPVVQQDAYVKMCAALAKAYLGGVVRVPGDVNSHFEWAPGRKNDPAGESRYARGRNMWNMTQFRGDVTSLLSAPPIVISPSSGAPMKVLNAPVRIFDTRPYGWLPAGEHVINAGQGNVEAVMVTVTVVPLGTPGFATLWGDGPRPNASVINWGPSKDTAVANTTVVRVVNGNFRLFTSTEANVIFDVQAAQ